MDRLMAEKAQEWNDSRRRRAVAWTENFGIGKFGPKDFRRLTAEYYFYPDHFPESFARLEDAVRQHSI